MAYRTCINESLILNFCTGIVIGVIIWVLCYSYLPFGGGPRKCVGDMFASYEVTSLFKYKHHDFCSFGFWMKMVENSVFLVLHLF